MLKCDPNVSSLSRLGKEHPDLPAARFYRPEELAVLEIKRKETGKYPQSQELTVLQANILAAMLVGFWGRTGDGHPGPRILAEGLRVLRALVWFERQWENMGRGPSRHRGVTKRDHPPETGGRHSAETDPPGSDV